MTRAVILFVLAPLAFAQGPNQRRVQAVGTASITIKPDQARISVGVTTNAATAQEAAAQNATQVDAVIKALTALIGSKGSIKTTSYSITPVYRTPAGQTQSQLAGYSANNTVQVSMNDLTIIGQVIDTAVQAGATNIGSPLFTLQDPDPVRQQALTAAAKQARSDADAIAAGLGARVGQVVSAQEGATYTPLRDATLTAGAGTTPTPIQPGTLEISATVTITAELQ
jgi:uncharacterized protein